MTAFISAEDQQMRHAGVRISSLSLGRMAPILYIVGDIHLDGRPNAFLPWLRALCQLPPARLVILGDLFEYWIDTEASAQRGQECSALLRKLHRAGWVVDLIIGNREMAAGRRLAIVTHARVCWPGLRFDLGPKRLHIVHGDRLCADPGQRFLHALLTGFWLQVARSVAPDFLQELVARGIRGLSRFGHARRAQQQDTERNDKSVGQQERGRVHLDPVRVWRSARGADYLVAGHIHESWRRQVNGVDLTLVGDWGAQRGSWVVGFADGRIERRIHDFSELSVPVGFADPAAVGLQAVSS